MIWRVGVVVLVALLGCKEKVPTDDDNLRERAKQMRDRMCACKERYCIRKVVEAYTPLRRNPIDADTTRYIEEARACERAIPEPPPKPPEPTESTYPAVPATTGDADALVRAAREYQVKRYAGMTVRTMHVFYVNSNGMLDEEHGALSVIHGAPEKPFDDPKRKTGAPAPVNPTKLKECPAFYWTMSDKQWTLQPAACPDTPAYVPRCKPTDIWKRAIEKGAPVDALATLELRHPPRWRFTIRDEPRDVNIRHDFADDCELAVEKP